MRNLSGPEKKLRPGPPGKALRRRREHSAPRISRPTQSYGGEAFTLGERGTCGPHHSVAWRSVPAGTRTHGFASHPYGWFAFVVDTRTYGLRGRDYEMGERILALQSIPGVDAQSVTKM